MFRLLKRLVVALDQPLTVRSRVLVAVAALALIPTFFAPLWHMNFLAQQ
jgi:hypothetical protein